MRQFMFVVSRKHQFIIQVFKVFFHYKTGVCILFQEKDVKIEREMMFRNVANHLRTCDIYCRGAAALLDCADDTKCV